MTLAELAVIVAVLGGLGLAASRFGLSAIPAYLVAGLLLGPNEPHIFSLVELSEVTDFVAELGLIFLLFFLGLEFSVQRLAASGRHAVVGGSVDLLVNGALGLLVGIAAFGVSFAALILAAAVYISSSAVTVKALIDFRRLADDETALILGILVFEDIVIAFVVGFAAGGGGGLNETLPLVAKALAFVTLSLAATRWLARPIDRVLGGLPREFFLLFAFALVVGMAAVASALGVSEAIGALMAGVILAETEIRTEIEAHFLGFRDLFAALFFFVFGLTIDVEAFGTVGWIVALGVVASVVGKLASGFFAGQLGGFTRRQSFNTGAALVAHGEFTIILAQIAAPALPAAQHAELVAFAGLYVLATAVVGVVLMKESKRIGRRLFPPLPRLRTEV